MMPVHMQTLWRSGRCPFLVPASFYAERGVLRTFLKTEGLVRVQDYALLCPDGIEQSFCSLLRMLSSAADHFAQLQSWLALPSYISLRPEDIYYREDCAGALLLFREEAESRPFFPRFCELCEDLGGSAGLIAERLTQAGGSCVMGERSTAAFLERWRREILSREKNV